MRLLPNPSLVPFDPEIERTLTHIRQARRRLAFAHTESDSLDEQPDSPLPSNRDSHSSFNEGTLYSSVGSSKVFVSDLGSGSSEYHFATVTSSLPGFGCKFELKTGLINLLPKYHGLLGEDLLKHLKDFQVVCSTARRHGSDEIAVMVFAFPFSLEEKAKEWFYTQPNEVITKWDLLRKEFL
ncbi:hypothetical protein AHAS_Ahas18G0106100 [Arachis hypogaea]